MKIKDKLEKQLSRNRTTESRRKEKENNKLRTELINQWKVQGKNFVKWFETLSKDKRLSYEIAVASWDKSRYVKDSIVKHLIEHLKDNLKREIEQLNNSENLEQQQITWNRESVIVPNSQYSRTKSEFNNYLSEINNSNQEEEFQSF